MLSSLAICPLDLAEANTLVSRWHRHHQAVPGAKFAIGVYKKEDPYVCGAAICGRSVARMNDTGWTLEVYRIVTDGTKNACSILYGACRRIGFAMGYQRIITYTLPSESGASLRGAGWLLIGERGGGSWDRENRPRVDKAPTCQKLLWEVCVATPIAEVNFTKKDCTENVGVAPDLDSLGLHHEAEGPS